MALITTPAEFGSRTLACRDFTNPNDTAQPSTIATALSSSMARVKGWVIGPPGQYAFFATTGAAFQSPPVGIQGLYPSALAIACGEDFEFLINSGQQIYTLGSISPDVPWGGPADLVTITFSVTYFSLQEIITDTRATATVLPPPPPVSTPVITNPTQIIVTPPAYEPNINVSVNLPKIPGLNVPPAHEAEAEQAPQTIKGPKAKWMKS